MVFEVARSHVRSTARPRICRPADTSTHTYTHPPPPMRTRATTYIHGLTTNTLFRRGGETCMVCVSLPRATTTGRRRRARTGRVLCAVVFHQRCGRIAFAVLAAVCFSDLASGQPSCPPSPCLPPPPLCVPDGGEDVLEDRWPLPHPSFSFPHVDVDMTACRISFS